MTPQHFSDCPPRLQDLLGAGSKFRMYGIIYHARGVVDDQYIALRSWSVRRGWRYKIDSVNYLAMAYESKALTSVHVNKRKRPKQWGLYGHITVED
jgi:hypothetical protein